MVQSEEVTLDRFARECFLGSSFTDLTLKKDSRWIKVHKLVVAAHSDFFRKILTSWPEITVMDMDEELNKLGFNSEQVDFNDLAQVISRIYDVESPCDSSRLSKQQLLAQVLGLRKSSLQISDWNQDQFAFYNEEETMDGLENIDIEDQFMSTVSLSASIDEFRPIQEHAIDEENSEIVKTTVCNDAPTDVSKLVRENQGRSNFIVLKNDSQDCGGSVLSDTQNILRREPVVLKPMRPDDSIKSSLMPKSQNDDGPHSTQVQQKEIQIEEVREEQEQRHLEQDLEVQGEVELPVETGSDLRLVLPTRNSNSQVSIKFSSDALAKMIQSNNNESFLNSAGSVESNEKRRKSCRRSTNRPLRDRSKVFRCSHCNSHFNTKVSLKRHERYHSISTLFCSTCKMSFRHKWQLQQHLSETHGSKNHKCDYCGQHFGFQKLLLAHINLHHREEEKSKRRCKLCPLTFMHQKNLIRHYEKEHKETNYPFCQICHTIFDSSKEMESHSCSGIRLGPKGGIFCQRNHGNSPIELKSIHDLEQHYRREHPEVTDFNKLLKPLKLPCPVCDKRFLRRESLTKHMRRYHDTSKSSEFPCRFCSKSFLQKGDRDDHENTHNSNADQVCSICSKTYSSKKALLRHKKLKHESQETFQCEICHKSLSSLHKLRAHLSVHSDARNFTCQICGVKFKARDNMERHIRKFHNSELHKNSTKNNLKVQDLREEEQ